MEDVLLTLEAKKENAYKMYKDFKDCDSPSNAIVWRKIYNQYVKAIDILKASESNEADSENANCAIFDVVQQRELLVAFSDFIKKNMNTDFIPSRIIDAFLSTQ